MGCFKCKFSYSFEVNEYSFIHSFIHSFIQMFYFALRIYFGPGQEYAKCDQISANINAGDFIILSVFLPIHLFKMFMISVSYI